MLGHVSRPIQAVPTRRMPPLGLISSFSLLDKAGYSCYVRAAYCDTGTEYHDDSSPGTRTFILTDRIEGSINLGDNVVRSLKDVGIPDGAEVSRGQCQTHSSILISNDRRFSSSSNSLLPAIPRSSRKNHTHFQSRHSVLRPTFVTAQSSIRLSRKLLASFRHRQLQ